MKLTKAKLFEDFNPEEGVNESINSRVRAKIVVHLKKHGLIHNEDYEYSGGEFIANDIETARDMMDAIAGTFKGAIYDDRTTKDGGVPVMITESINEAKFMSVWDSFATNGGLDEFLRYTKGPVMKKAIKQHMGDPSKMRQMDYILTVPPEMSNPTIAEGNLRNGRDTYTWTIFDYKGVNIMAVGIGMGKVYYFTNEDNLNENAFSLQDINQHLAEVEVWEEESGSWIPVNEAETKQGKKDVNIFVGRFQPFHIGHYKAAEELYKKNGKPVVLVSVRGSGKSGKGTAFTEPTMKKMMKDVIAKSGFIIDHKEIKMVAFDTQLFPALRPQYEPVLFGAGEDRTQTYERQRLSMMDKHKNVLNMRDDFAIHLTGRYGSGTETRQAIQDNDILGFENQMPKFLHGYWDVLRKEMSANESVNEGKYKLNQEVKYIVPGTTDEMETGKITGFEDTRDEQFAIIDGKNVPFKNISEAYAFKQINSRENKIKLAIKDVEKKARLKINRNKPPEYDQLSLNKIMLSKVLAREWLGKEHEEAWEKLKKEYDLKENELITEAMGPTSLLVTAIALGLAIRLLFMPESKLQQLLGTTIALTKASWQGIKDFGYAVKRELPIIGPKIKKREADALAFKQNKERTDKVKGDIESYIANKMSDDDIIEIFKSNEEFKWIIKRIAKGDTSMANTKFYNAVKKMLSGKTSGSTPKPIMDLMKKIKADLSMLESVEFEQTI
jgi:cytidyltransferase-like protein